MLDLLSSTTLRSVECVVNREGELEAAWFFSKIEFGGL